MRKSFQAIQALILISFFFCAVGAITVQAQNAALTVQGILKKADGSAVPDDIYTLRFALFDAEVGGTEVWFEVINDVETTGGVYSVVLGVNGKALDAPFDKPYYLSVKIGNSSQELLPRPRLSAAPYALSLLGSQNKVPSTGNITAFGLVAANGISGYNLEAGNGGVVSAGVISAQGGILANTGAINSGTGPFEGYGFLGDGRTGYGSNGYGIASIWAGSENVMNATNADVTFTKFVKITGTKTLSYTGTVRSMSGSGFETLGNYNSPFSLETDGYIKPYGVYVISDRRVKKDLKSSDAAADLAQLLRLRVTDYRYKDVISRGETWKKGFIAQEVEQVVPEAISTSTEVIPDIYALAKNTRLAAGALQITMEQPHGLKAGDKVRLMAGSNQEDLLVQAAPSATEFTVSGWTHEAPEKVFVYGREVTDFHTVDYDRLFTMNISATQELARRVESLEKENAAYKAQNDALRTMIEGLRADVNALKGQQQR